MNAVLAQGASQLGLTTTTLPIILDFHDSNIYSSPTTTPLSPVAQLHRRLIEDQQREKSIQEERRMGRQSANGRTHNSRRRRKRQHKHSSMIGPGLLFLETGDGYYLSIHPSGKVNGQKAREGHGLFSILKIMTAAFLTWNKKTPDHPQKQTVTIKGINSNNYLCMNSSGTLYGRSDDHEDCYFYEETSGTRYYYISARYGKYYDSEKGGKKRWRKEWLVGLNKDGSPRPGYRTLRKNRYGAFITIPEDNSPRPRPSVFDPRVIPNLPVFTTKEPQPHIRHHHGTRRGDCSNERTIHRQQLCLDRQQKRRERQRSREKARHASTTTRFPGTTAPPSFVTGTKEQATASTTTASPTNTTPYPAATNLPTTAPPVDVERKFDISDTLHSTKGPQQSVPLETNNERSRGFDFHNEGLFDFNKMVSTVIKNDTEQVGSLAKMLSGDDAVISDPFTQMLLKQRRLMEQIRRQSQLPTGGANAEVIRERRDVGRRRLSFSTSESANDIRVRTLRGFRSPRQVSFRARGRGTKSVFIPLSDIATTKRARARYNAGVYSQRAGRRQRPLAKSSIYNYSTRPSSTVKNGIENAAVHTTRAHGYPEVHRRFLSGLSLKR